MSFYVTFAMHAIQIIAINSLKSSSLEILGDAIRNDIEKLTSSILVAEKHALLCSIHTYPGNALERVQRVHEPADLWDITF